MTDSATAELYIEEHPWFLLILWHLSGLWSKTFWRQLRFPPQLSIQTINQEYISEENIVI